MKHVPRNRGPVVAVVDVVDSVEAVVVVGFLVGVVAISL